MPNIDGQVKWQAWCSSKETKKALHISDCELMHLRLAGKLEFIKKGNAFFYLIDKNKATEVPPTD